MPPADFFARFGLYVARGFLDPATCAAVRAEMTGAREDPATVVAGDAYAVDDRVRRTKVVAVPPATATRIAARLETLRPELERHFRVRGVRWRAPEFLVYRAGDFFVLHRDAAVAPKAAAVVRGRRVSAIVFLNDSSEEPGPDRFGGAALTFYGLLEDPRGSGVGFPLASEEGLLVAFPADLLHEVSPVTHGERYTIVSWLHDA